MVEEEEQYFSVSVRTTHKQSHYIREVKEKNLRSKVLGNLSFFTFRKVFENGFDTDPTLQITLVFKSIKLIRSRVVCKGKLEASTAVSLSW